MRIIITDSSCLIDLKKGGVLHSMLTLPFEFAIPQPLMEDELLSLTEEDKESLVAAGLNVITLSGALLLRAQAYHAENSRPSFNDYFALILSEETDDSILLTGDTILRKVAEEKDIEAYGVLWVLDQLHACKCATKKRLCAAIKIYIEDNAVWLPESELKRRLKTFG